MALLSMVAIAAAAPVARRADAFFSAVGSTPRAARSTSRADARRDRAGTYCALDSPVGTASSEVRPSRHGRMDARRGRHPPEPATDRRREPVAAGSTPRSRQDRQASARRVTVAGAGEGVATTRTRGFAVADGAWTLARRGAPSAATRRAERGSRDPHPTAAASAHRRRTESVVGSARARRRESWREPPDQRAGTVAPQPFRRVAVSVPVALPLTRRCRALSRIA